MEIELELEIHSASASCWLQISEVVALELPALASSLQYPLSPLLPAAMTISPRGHVKTQRRADKNLNISIIKLMICTKKETSEMINTSGCCSRCQCASVCVSAALQVCTVSAALL